MKDDPTMKTMVILPAAGPAPADPVTSELVLQNTRTPEEEKAERDVKISKFRA